MSKQQKIIVIKIGSSVLLTKRNKLDQFRISHIADQISVLRKEGIGLILVVSGAVAAGVYYLVAHSGLITNARDRLSRRQADLHLLSDGFLKQAVAGVGQVQLISIFNQIFSQQKIQIAQILLTKNNLQNNTFRHDLRTILEFHLSSGFVPMLNENDVIDLNSFGGNDYLAAEITTLLSADKLLILSTKMGSQFGVGGGHTKEQVINILDRKNIETVILDGKVKNILLEELLQ